MNRFLLILLLLFASCSKEAFAPGCIGFVSLNGEKVIDIACGVKEPGRTCWYLFNQENSEYIHLGSCSVFLLARMDSQTLDIQHVSLHRVPEYGNIYLTFEGSGHHYTVHRAFASGEGADDLGTAVVNSFVFNTSAKVLKVDIRIHMEDDIHIVFRGRISDDASGWYWE